jgi:hypothetical protein
MATPTELRKQQLWTASADHLGGYSEAKRMKCSLEPHHVSDSSCGLVPDLVFDQLNLLDACSLLVGVDGEVEGVADLVGTSARTRTRSDRPRQ